MKRKDERLDQRLGDFGPLHQPIDEIAFERLLDRHGLVLVYDYPQLLFERSPQWQLPGWRPRWHPRWRQDYPVTHYGWPDYLARDGLATRLSSFEGTKPERPGSPLARLAEAYRIFDEIYAPPRRRSPAQPSQTSNHGNYRRRSSYSH